MGLDDDEICRDDYLTEYLNTAAGVALRNWEKSDFCTRFSPPTTATNVKLDTHRCGIDASVITMGLDIGHLIFEVVIVDSSYEFLTGEKILVTDDSQMIRQMLSRKLSEVGFEIEIARDGKEAVEKLKEFQPDLVIMDQIMPKKNGLDAITEILKFSPDAKFVMFSSSATQDELNTARTFKVKSYLVKPLNFEKLDPVISNVFLPLD